MLEATFHFFEIEANLDAIVVLYLENENNASTYQDYVYPRTFPYAIGWHEGNAAMRQLKVLPSGVRLDSKLFTWGTVQPARNLHLNTRHRDLPQRVRWNWPPRSVFFVDISGGHRCSIAHGSEHRATRCTNTADRDGRTRWSLVVINKCLHLFCWHLLTELFFSGCRRPTT